MVILLLLVVSTSIFLIRVHRNCFTESTFMVRTTTACDHLPSLVDENILGKTSLLHGCTWRNCSVKTRRFLQLLVVPLCSMFSLWTVNTNNKQDATHEGESKLILSSYWTKQAACLHFTAAPSLHLQVLLRAEQPATMTTSRAAEQLQPCTCRCHFTASASVESKLTLVFSLFRFFPCVRFTHAVSRRGGRHCWSEAEVTREVLVRVTLRCMAATQLVRHTAATYDC